jgi:antitoxin (DNA-binding transcriptional repressor) of toxin-antitoxin stability system
MKAVGIKELKAHLSEYVREARGGNTILVTERGTVVAELRATSPRRLVAADAELQDTLEALDAAGEITHAAPRRRGWTWKAAGLGLPAGTAVQLLGEIRADRT